MQSRSLARELALLVLGQVSERDQRMRRIFRWIPCCRRLSIPCMFHWRESLDTCATDLEKAQQALLDSELQDGGDRRASGGVTTCARRLDHGRASAEWAVQQP